MEEMGLRKQTRQSKPLGYTSLIFLTTRYINPTVPSSPVQSQHPSSCPRPIPQKVWHSNPSQSLRLGPLLCPSPLSLLDHSYSHSKCTMWPQTRSSGTSRKFTRDFELVPHVCILTSSRGIEMSIQDTGSQTCLYTGLTCVVIKKKKIQLPRLPLAKVLI